MTQFPETQSTLIAQIRSPQNREAWAQFVSLYRPVIYRMARKRGMQDADAQDLTQGVLIRVAGAIDRWEKTSPDIGFRNWLARIAKNAIYSALSRAPSDRADGGTDFQELLNAQPESNSEVDNELALEYCREQYHRAAAIVRSDVHVETWRAFELSVVEGRSCEEVADLIRKPIGTVYAARGRVMRRLRDEVNR